MKHLFLFISLCSVLISCDPGVHFERIIENNSSHDLWIKVSGDPYPAFISDSFMIPKNSTMIVGSRGGLGTVSTVDCNIPNTTFFTSGTSDNDTLSIQKDLNNDWNYTIVKETVVHGG